MLFFLALALSFAQLQYGVMMDAGSSGTRAHLFQWRQMATTMDESHQIPAGFEPSEVRPTQTTSVAFSDARIVKTPALVGPLVLQPLLDAVIRALEAAGEGARVVSTPVYVRATAGVRSLPATTRDAIMQAARTFIRKQYDFMFKDEWCSVLTGVYEGVFGFVAVNYLLDRLVSAPLATVDQGGQSMEMTTADVSGTPAGDRFHLKLGNTTLELWTNMWPDAGSNFAFSAYIEQLTSSASPCTPLGYNGTFVNDQGHLVKVYGTSDVGACFDAADAVRQKYAATPVHAPSLAAPAAAPLYLLGTYPHLMAFAPDIDVERVFTVDALEAAARVYCALSWSAITANRTWPAPSAAGDTDYRLVSCFKLAYGVATLRAANASHLRAPLDINDVSASWAFGAMLYEANLLDWGDYCAESRSCDECAPLRGCGWCAISGACVVITSDVSPHCVWPRLFLYDGDDATRCGGLRQTLVLWLSLLGTCVGSVVLACCLLVSVRRCVRRRRKRRRLDDVARFLAATDKDDGDEQHPLLHVSDRG